MARAARGRPPGHQEKIWRDAIRRAVLRRVDGKTGPQALERLADALVTSGLTGDVAATREIGDRLDGKPAQAIGGDADGAPVEMVIRWASEAPRKS